jgi:outer membrane receptor protein involved in Fe transport
LPTYQELFWTGDSISHAPDIRAEHHTVVEAGLDIRPAEGTTVRIAWFSRSIDDPILIESAGSGPVFPALRFANGGTLRSDGIEAGLNARVWVLQLEGNGVYLLQKDENGDRLRTLPAFSGTGGLYYWNTVLDGKLEIKAGIRGRYVSTSAGELFNPEATAYVPNTVYEPGQGSSVDALLFARVGGAHIHFLWTNLTSAKYFLTPFYPVRDRGIRFGIAWEFLD